MTDLEKVKEFLEWAKQRRKLFLIWKADENGQYSTAVDYVQKTAPKLLLICEELLKACESPEAIARCRRQIEDFKTELGSHVPDC